MPTPSAEKIVEAFRLLGIETQEERDRVVDKLKSLRSQAKEEMKTYILVSQEWETNR